MMDEYAYVNWKEIKKRFYNWYLCDSGDCCSIEHDLKSGREEKVTVHTASGVEVTMDVHNPSLDQKKRLRPLKKMAVMMRMRHRPLDLFDCDPFARSDGNRD